MLGAGFEIEVFEEGVRGRNFFQKVSPPEKAFRRS
jgi:hypothetical protein